MVIGCEAELYLHKLQAETKRVSELTRSISERSQSRLTWSRACAPCTCLAHFGRTCTGLDRGVSGDPVRGGRAELLVLCGGRDEQQGSSCWCCVGGRAEQQASQPPIWGDGNRSFFVSFFLPDHHRLFFFFFSGHALQAPSSHKKTQSRAPSSGKKTQSRAPSRTRRRADQGHTQGRVWPLRQFHWEEIWLSGSDQPIPGANEFKATGCAALTLIRLRTPVRGQARCRGVPTEH